MLLDSRQHQRSGIEVMAEQYSLAQQEPPTHKIAPSSKLCSEIEEALAATGFRRRPESDGARQADAPQSCRKKLLALAARSPRKLTGDSGLHHPLGLLLDKFRTAEAAWLQQKAELRRGIEAQKKRADRAELELNKLLPLHQARGQEVKGLRAALRQRTQQNTQLETQNARLQQSEGQACTQVADQLASLAATTTSQATGTMLDDAAERDSLAEKLQKSGLHAEEAACQSQEQQTRIQLLQDKVEILQQARQAAVEQAGEAAREAEGLRASARQHAWSQRLLDTLLSDQLQQNQQR
ncbi:hypothetical protein WJX84_000974 [Apatococcus fuscideae]|uniref:Uncharacterized protein n=1 Tax=Apatococcus fuscideae TaxID=2026836 RepID=A0AAW1TFB6_9CHLO